MCFRGGLNIEVHIQVIYVIYLHHEYHKIDKNNFYIINDQTCEWEIMERNITLIKFIRISKSKNYKYEINIIIFT